MLRTGLRGSYPDCAPAQRGCELSGFTDLLVVKSARGAP